MIRVACQWAISLMVSSSAHWQSSSTIRAGRSGEPSASRKLGECLDAAAFAEGFGPERGDDLPVQGLGQFGQRGADGVVLVAQPAAKPIGPVQIGPRRR